AWVAANSGGRPIGVDTEGTGLDIYSPTFRLRTVQVGHETEAWVIPVELGPEFMTAAVDALRRLPTLVLHNASFDARVLAQCTPLEFDELWPAMTDTRILAHLVDPRTEHEGGLGLGLKTLSAKLIDPDAPD